MKVMVMAVMMMICSFFEVDNQAAETSPLNWSQTDRDDIWTYAPNHKSKGMTLDLRKNSYSNYEGRDLPRRAFTTGALKSSCSETNLNLITGKAL